MVTSRILRLNWIVVFILITANALSAIPLQLNHQGVVKVSGVAYSGSGDFSFALIDGTSGNNLWTNDGSQLGTTNAPDAAVTLTVAQGLYSVNLGDTSLTNMTAVSSTVFDSDNVLLRIWFNDGSGAVQLSPDLPMSSVPYAYSAGKATLADQATAATDSVTLQGEAPSDFHDAAQLSGTVSTGSLPTSVMLEGENNSLLNNDSGFINSESDTLDTVTDRGASTSNTIIVGGVVSNSVYSETMDTGQGANELYAMDQDVQTSDEVAFSTVNTGQGANELYAMDQDVQTSDEVAFSTVNTGQGANELYAMDQNVQTTDSVAFFSVSAGGPALDQSNTLLTGNWGTSAGDSVAQVFTAGQSGVITKAKIWAGHSGTPGNVSISIYSGNTPGSGSLLSSVETVNVTNLFSTSVDPYEVTFATPAPVTSGQQYYILADNVPDMFYGYTLTNPYSGGSLWNYSGIWSEQTTRDLCFGTYVVYVGDVLTASGPFLVQEPVSPPSSTTDRLYNSGGNLFWNGTQLDAAGSSGDFKADGSVAMTGDLDLGGNGITNLGTDLADGDVADDLTITGGTINGSSIGITTSAAGKFTVLSANSVNTGQGANELYAMNQNVLTTSDVTFNSVAGGTFNAGSGSVVLPQGTDVSGNTAEGRISWDTDDDKLYVGDGSAVKEIGASGGSTTVTDVISINLTNGDITFSDTWHAFKLTRAGTIVDVQTYCYADNGRNLQVQKNGTMVTTSAVDFTPVTVVQGTMKTDGTEDFVAGDTIGFYIGGSGTVSTVCVTLVVEY